MEYNLRRLIKKITNPLLFYVDKSGNSIFKNYCLYKNDGCLYNEAFSIKTAGKVLEYRMELDKKLNYACIIITLALYLILVSKDFSFGHFLACEILWLILFLGGRFLCAYLYKERLISTFGQYSLTNFSPNISPQKQKDFNNNFIAKYSFILLILLIFFSPTLFLLNLIKLDLNSKKPFYKAAIVMSNIYGFLYPRNEKLLDMSAYAKYKTGDYEGALKEYKEVLELSGKKFTKEDFTRFANLLYLEKRLYGSQDAIDLFNDYATRKNMSVIEQEQMLWIKSIFSISNRIPEAVIADYDDLLNSLNKKDKKNEFYILTDKAYMYYLMGRYADAIKIYDALISYAQKDDKKTFEKDLPSLYAERGFAKRQSGDLIGADTDFNFSKINIYDLKSYEPTISGQGFVVEKF